MDDPPVVHVLDAEANLREPVEHLIFGEVLLLTCCFVLLSQGRYFCTELAIVTVFHDNVESAVLRQIDLLEAYDIGMI